MAMEEKKTRYQRVAQHIGIQLQKRRKRSGLSLEGLAAKLDISHQQLHKYEKAANSIPADRLYFLAGILDVPLTYFFEGFVEEREERHAGTKRGESLNILLVEDDPADAILIRKALDSCEKKNKLHLVHDGREALNFLNAKSRDNTSLPDLIFLDLNIPSIEGFPLLKEIKKHPTLSHIPIIIITSSMDDDNVVKSYKGQASGVIRKTGDKKEFNKHISSIVDCWSSAMTLPVS
ncbi:MAG: response regulator [Alphaproteobacteria bacterium]|nr:response regulator [Alphaproteobacteria bacterium]